MDDVEQTQISSLQARVKELEDAIRYHAEQRGDDRCFLDDLALYKLIGIEEHPGLNLPVDQFLSNCRRYWTCQQTGAEYQKAVYDIPAQQQIRTDE
ncbi:MAG TPA: hypothetical protein V6C76_12120 [Drouetiella sp.]